MIHVDYFLFDNRTWTARIGHDWAVKAATGVLAARPDLRASFTRYCGALPSDHGYLGGFGQALGGILSKTDGGYLLCVTLETTDHFRRPSWSTYGLWCPDATTLESVLLVDPVASARAVLGAETPPPAIALKSARLSLPPRRRQNDTKTAFQRFDQKTTVAEVISILLGSIRGRTALPDILGITASSRLPQLGHSFSLVYCQPLDGRATQAFARYRTGAEPLEEVPEPPAGDPTPAEARTPASDSIAARVYWAASVAAVIALILAWMYAQNLPTATGEPMPSLCAQVDEVARLDPERLSNAVTSLSNLDGKARLTGDAAFADLFEAQNRIAAQRCAGERSPHDSATAVDETSLLQGTNACTALESLDIADPEVHRWCDSLRRLQRMAASIVGPQQPAEASAVAIEKNEHPAIEGAAKETMP